MDQTQHIQYITYSQLPWLSTHPIIQSGFPQFSSRDTFGDSTKGLAKGKANKIHFSQPQAQAFHLRRPQEQLGTVCLWQMHADFPSHHPSHVSITWLPGGFAPSPFLKRFQLQLSFVFFTSLHLYTCRQFSAFDFDSRFLGFHFVLEPTWQLLLYPSWSPGHTHTQPLPCRADHSCALVLQDLMVCLLSINTVSYGNLPKISQTSQSLLSRSSRLEFSAPLGSQTQATNSSLLWKLPILSVTHRAATPWLKLHTSTRAGLKISIYPLPCPARLLEVEGFFLSFFLYSFPVDFFPLCC